MSRRKTGQERSARSKNLAKLAAKIERDGIALSQGIQEALGRNEKLKQELAELGEVIEEHEKKISELEKKVELSDA